MTDTFATFEQLEARLSSAYTVTEDEGEKLLLKASELIDHATLGRAQTLFESDDDEDEARQTMLAEATCDQVEFWLEVGEEHDVTGLPMGSSLQGGRVQVQKMPGWLGRRPLRTLLRAGLYYAGVGVQ